MSKLLFLDAPKDFSFRRTVSSHGWCELAPFALDRENWRLERVFTGAGVESLAVELSEASERRVKIEISGEAINERSAAKILRDARHVLRLDDDLSGFYEVVRTEKRLEWIAETNAGRMLRSPTVFEDLVKTLCTTNCSWALTKKMTANLVEKLGASDENGNRAFPTVEAMANAGLDFYKNEMRAGYRARYFVELAEKVAGGEINPEIWLASDSPSKELKREMKTVKGVGEYAADNLLKLVGRYDGLALDSWLRAGFYKRHNNGAVCSDKNIEKFYERFGAWRGLVMWCDMSNK